MQSSKEVSFSNTIQLFNNAMLFNDKYTLSSERTYCGLTKIGFFEHPQMSPFFRETGFNSSVIQEDVQNWRILSLDRVYKYK